MSSVPSPLWAAVDICLFYNKDLSCECVLMYLKYILVREIADIMKLV